MSRLSSTRHAAVSAGVLIYAAISTRDSDSSISRAWLYAWICMRPTRWFCFGYFLGPLASLGLCTLRRKSEIAGNLQAVVIVRQTEPANRPDVCAPSATGDISPAVFFKT